MPIPAPPVAALDVPLGSPTRPAWRGRLHLIGLTVALPVTIVIAILASGARARAGVIVYAVGLCATFGVSVTYHRWVHTIRARALWRRADHATIYSAIAGTFTPLTLMAFGTPASVLLLIVVWSAALCGAVIKIAGARHADRIGVILYLSLGWAGVLLVPALWQRAGTACVALLFAGGVAYTAGAVGFGRRWPVLGPSVFSYHEVWHAFTLLGAGSHLAAVWITAT